MGIGVLYTLSVIISHILQSRRDLVPTKEFGAAIAAKCFVAITQKVVPVDRTVARYFVNAGRSALVTCLMNTCEVPAHRFTRLSYANSRQVTFL